MRVAWKMMICTRAKPNSFNVFFNKSLSMEYQGMGKPAFFFSFQRLGQLYHPELCILLETRLCGSSLEHVHCRFSGKWGFYAIQSQDLLDGIIITWDQGIARVNVFHQCSQQVAIAITELNGFTWLLSRCMPA